jgi:hypothetical protein
MRTTVTLDLDVETPTRTAMKERGLSFKDALNSAVRAGLTQAASEARFRSEVVFNGGRTEFPLGQSPGRSRSH